MDTTYLFDNAISNKQLQIMKTAIPYIHPKQQKMFSLFIIIQEMKNTIKLFNNSNNEEIGICSIKTENKTTENMIKDIKKILDEKEKEKIDNILNIISILNIFNTTKDFDPVDSVMSMLSPEQHDLFEMYSTILNNSGQAN